MGRDEAAHHLRARHADADPLAGAAPILEQHHERLDGSGYPQGLKGDEIRLEAQIVAVVDTYDAMTSNRIYRPARSHDEAVTELQREAGRLYRSEVVETFLRVLSNLASIPSERWFDDRAPKAR